MRVEEGGWHWKEEVGARARASVEPQKAKERKP